MRIGKRGFQARIKGELRIEFGDEKLTSFAGLELLRRFLRAVDFVSELRRSEHKLGLGGDFSLVRLVLTIVGMLIAGAKRLHHLAFLGDDPVFLRFAGLSRAPTERTLSRALKKMTFRTWSELDRLATLVARASLDGVDAHRWTLDIDGSVLTTGLHVERAKRGFNPHHRKNPSYYPILCTIAQTGHVLGHQNRRGNVHDSHGAAEFLRRNVRTARDDLGFARTIEVRVDGAFFRRDFLAACDGCSVEYAVKVPMMSWLNLRAIVKKHGNSHWQWIDRKAGVQALDTVLPIPQWNRTERIVIYRKRVNHKSPKSHQLDLFNPDDGEWEYSVVATNKTLRPLALWHFQNGRGTQEKTIGELKSGFAFGSIPTNRYSANTAWQKLNVLAHNIVTSFQIATTATQRPRSLKRTATYVLRSIATLRFEWLAKAGRLLRPGGAPILRLADNSATHRTVAEIQRALEEAA